MRGGATKLRGRELGHIESSRKKMAAKNLKNAKIGARLFVFLRRLALFARLPVGCRPIKLEYCR